MIDALSAASRGAGVPAGQDTGQTANLTDQFLKILTTQLQAQDPLSPMDQGAMFDQIARLTELQGLTEQRDHLATIQQQQALLGQLASTGLIGRSASVPSNHLTLPDSGTSDAFVTGPPGLDVDVAAVDGNGNELLRTRVTLGADGSARIPISGPSGSEVILKTWASDGVSQTQTHVTAPITGVRYSDGTIRVETPYGDKELGDLFWIGTDPA